MNQKLIVLIGPSGSGKSTFAKQYIKENPNTVRVNRDDMRRQVLGELTQDYYSKENNNIRTKLEKHITVVQNEMIRYWLQHEFDVIADNTHLRKEDVKNYVDNFEYLADIYVKPIPVDKIIAKNRIILREGVGTDLSYIDRQYDQFIKIPEELKNLPTGIFPIGFYIPKKKIPKIEYNPQLPGCYICDIDGSIADCTGIRSPYDGHLLHLDRPIEATRRILDYIDSSNPEWFEEVHIIYVSGREDKWMEATSLWINNNGFPLPELIYMRKTGDTRKDTIVKKEIYENHIKGKYNVLGVIDDRLSVTRAYHELGLFVFNVNQELKYF